MVVHACYPSTLTDMNDKSEPTLSNLVRSFLKIKMDLDAAQYKGLDSIPCMGVGVSMVFKIPLES